MFNRIAIDVKGRKRKHIHKRYCTYKKKCSTIGKQINQQHSASVVTK